MGLSEISLRSLDRAGFKTPSPIQARLIPAALAGRDCLGNAPTGTGKTAAFLLPILEKIDERERRPQALILAPTRELVTQIGREFERLSYGRRAYAVGGGRRRVDHPPAADARPGLPGGGRHPRPPDGPDGPPRDPARQGQDRGARRGRPDARHRVPARRRGDPPRRPRAGPPDPAPLGHHAEGSPRAGQHVPERPRGRPPHPRERGRDDPGDQAVVPDGPGRPQVRPAHRPDPPRGAASRHRLLPDQAGGRPGRAAAPPGGLQGRHDARQPQPGPAQPGPAGRSGSAGSRSWSRPTSSAGGSTSGA